LTHKPASAVALVVLRQGFDAIAQGARSAQRARAVHTIDLSFQSPLNETTLGQISDIAAFKA
jgi:hypothetical protein